MIPKINYTEHDLDIMARTLFGEAREKDKADAAAIAWVIRNRLEYGINRWGRSIANVCQAPMQFSCWNENDPNRNRIRNASYAGEPWLRACESIAKSVLDGKVNDPTVRSTHYHTPDVAPKWSRGKTPIYTTKGHIFFNDIDTEKPQHALHHRDTVNTATVAGVGTAAGGVAVAIDPEPVMDVVTDNAHLITTLLHGDAKYIALALVVGLIIGVVLWRLTRRGKL
jgi:N-acetylmuramoyl-L-alanine amidase